MSLRITKKLKRSRKKVQKPHHRVTGAPEGESFEAREEGRDAGRGVDVKEHHQREHKKTKTENGCLVNTIEEGRGAKRRGDFIECGKDIKREVEN